MKKILLIFTTLITFALSLPLVVTPVSSANCVLNVVSQGEPTVNNPLSFYIDNAVPGSIYGVNLSRNGFGSVYNSGSITASGTTINLEVPGSSLSVVGLYEFQSFRLSDPFEDCSDPPPFNVVALGAGSSCTSFLNCIGTLNPVASKYPTEEGLAAKLISDLLPTILGIFGFLTVIMIVISGIQFITSSGNPEGAAAARGRLTFALVGFIVIILALAILQIIDRIFLGTPVA